MINRRLFLALPALFVPRCSDAQTVQVTGAGSSFVAPLMQRWATEAEPIIGTRVNYQSIGSGGGVNQIRARTITFGATDAPLSDPGDMFQFPVVEGEVVAIINIPGIRSLNLNMELINQIYSGRITRWNDLAIQALNPNTRIPPMPIGVIYRADGSGTTYIWTHAMQRAGNWADAGTSVRWPVGQGARGNEGVANMVTRTPGSIGYVEKVYARVNNIAFATLDVEVKGKTYVLLPRQPTNRATHDKAVEFFEYAFTRGGDVARRLFYGPLTEQEYAPIITELKSI